MWQAAASFATTTTSRRRALATSRYYRQCITHIVANNTTLGIKRSSSRQVVLLPAVSKWDARRSYSKSPVYNTSTNNNTTTATATTAIPEEAPSNLEKAIDSIHLQAIEHDRIQSVIKPTPWFSLLHYPSRAAWRSTDHLLGSGSNNNNNSSNELDQSNTTSPLSQTQFNLLQHSERTNKQLKRTYKRIMDTHSVLGLKRERERRAAANYLLQGGGGGKSRGAGNGFDNRLKFAQDVDVDNDDDENVDHDDNNENVDADDGNSMNDIATLKGDASSNKTEASASKSTSLSPPLSSMVDDPSVALALGSATNPTLAKSANKLLKSSKGPTATTGSSKDSKNKEKPIGYGPEQTLTHVRYRLGPNYSIVRRVLLEVQSLLGGSTHAMSSSSGVFQPRRILDFGSGVGSSSAAALDVFGISRTTNDDDGNTTTSSSGIDWIHSIDASKSMRDASEKVLKSVLENVPWGFDDPSIMKPDTSHDGIEDEEQQQQRELEEAIQRIKGGNTLSESREERRRRKMQKWEQTWTKQTNARTRITFGESIVDASSFPSDHDESQQLQRQEPKLLPWQKEQPFNHQWVKEPRTQHTQKGSFDLVLCTYTLSELPTVASGLTAAALLWEKLAPGGVMVLVEPGTPDGFSILRSVRTMLLECCPPEEVQRRKRSNNDDRAENGIRLEGDPDQDHWHEECHVIAPCTHNGTCPMSRHKMNHVKQNTRFGKYEAAKLESAADTAADISANEEMAEEDMMKELLGDAENMSDEELDEMMKLMEEMDDDDFEDDDEEEYQDDEEEIDDSTESLSASTPMAQTNVFSNSFCSFVHNFPGGMRRKKGEKFSYLVVQKRTLDSTTSSDSHVVSNPMAPDGREHLNEVDIVEMLAESVHHANKYREEQIRLRKQERAGGNSAEREHSNDHLFGQESSHESKSIQLLQKAAKIESEYLDSTANDLGLEFLHGDERRKGWGRLIRAPLKKKGHVLLDYCSGGCSGSGACSGESNKRNDEDGGHNRMHGRIIRQKVSRGWSLRVAPGCYGAARKARWGGLWPDLS